ncbi:MAG: hypothetical protein E7612_02610 [Ruminococcaceae bacterium]|nr:hypothetical protein [Oscillospiraceae bacterium]
MIYKGKKTKNISFPLGGIGTGCIGLAGNGELKDFEIFNRPNKCSRNGYSHFAIKASYADKKIVKILHGDTNENLMGTPGISRGQYGFGHGINANSLAGFPHLKKVSFNGNFPIAELSFSDNDFPAVIRLYAFNPFIPHDEFNSSLPAAFFEWEIENIADETIKFALGCTVCNPASSSVNEKVACGNSIGALLKSANMSDSEIGYSDLCILTDNDDSTVQEYWYRGKWQENCTTYWKNFTNLDRMPERSYAVSGKNDHSTVVSYVDIPAGKKAKLRFVISWNVPNAYNYWKTDQGDKNADATWKNYYATKFKDSYSTAKYSLENFDTLYNKTLLFSDALQSSTLPSSVKDAISANLSVIKTPTVLRLEDGSFWGWEGCCETEGSCFGTCQHVWNYAYVMPYLFPSLERSIRDTTIKYALQDSGATSFRVDLPLKHEMSTARACVDGQMGEVIKCYREWKFSGDTNWLKKNSESIFKMLEYAWSEKNPDKWDADMDGVLEGRQHHTLDLELFGPSSWLQGLYLLALDCASEIARFIGDEKRANLYSKLYQNGKTWLNEHLFNGKYFHQLINLSDKSLLDSFGCAEFYWNEEANEIKFQVADGCIIDQMLADWHAGLLGIRGVFDTAKKRTALENLYKNNYKASMREVTNMWRNFSLNDEAGTIICSYPEGAKIPAIPISYCEETMTGFEYALAGLMISEGYIDEGESIVKAVRDRYDGEKRNPWNEIECGSNYARSMASYALMPIYSGFTFDMTNRHIGFAPLSEKGKYLFSACDTWGKVEFNGKNCAILILGNPLVLDSIEIPGLESIKNVSVDGKDVKFEISNNRVVFNNVTIYKELLLK